MIVSSLDRFRQSIRSPLVDGEKLVARSQASLDGGSPRFARWKPGFLSLTPTRLLFHQGDNQLLEFPLTGMREINVVERRWVSRKTCEQLELRSSTERGTRKVHLRIDEPQKWKALIVERVREERPKTIASTVVPCGAVAETRRAEGRLHDVEQREEDLPRRR